MIGSKKSLREHFPHVDDTWATVLVMALRMKQVSGPRIGEILQEVEDHCAASGEGAEQAFGEARAYAESLDYAGQQRAPQQVRGSDLVQGCAQLLGASLTTWGFIGAVHGNPVAVTAGALLSAALTLTALFIAVRYLDRLMGAGLPWLFIGLNVALIAGVIAVLSWGGPELLSLPAWPCTIVGLALMIVPAVRATIVNAPARDDLILVPGERPSRGDRRKSRVLGLVAIWMLPVVIVGLSLSLWLAGG